MRLDTASTTAILPQELRQGGERQGTRMSADQIFDYVVVSAGIAKITVEIRPGTIPRPNMIMVGIR